MKITDEKKTEIYERFSGKVKGYFYQNVNDSYLAEDLCADVFLKVYEKIDSFDDSKAAISTWIYTIARNTLIDYYRTRKVYSEVPEEMPTDDSVEEEVCNNETLEMLANALEKLDERERDIIILHYYKNEKLKDIGVKMNISYAYVKLLHSKALQTLRTYCDFAIH